MHWVNKRSYVRPLYTSFCLLVLTSVLVVIVLTSDAESFAKPFTTESLLLSILLVVFEYSSAILMTIRSIQAFRIGGAWNMQRQRLLYVILEQGYSTL